MNAGLVTWAPRLATILIDSYSEIADQLLIRIAASYQQEARPDTVCSLQSTTKLSLMDGAVIIDTAGSIYGTGFIVDGSARPQREDPARGARYNSAVRYVLSRNNLAVALVASSDGTVERLDWRTLRADDP